MKMHMLIYVFSLLVVLLPLASSAPIDFWAPIEAFTPIGSSTNLPDLSVAGPNYADFIIAKGAPLTSAKKEDGPLLDRFPIFDFLLPWGITKTDSTISSVASVEPERGSIIENTSTMGPSIGGGILGGTTIEEVQQQAKKSGGWKKAFGRFWGWVKGLFGCFGGK